MPAVIQLHTIPIVAKYGVFQRPAHRKKRGATANEIHRLMLAR